MDSIKYFWAFLDHTHSKLKCPLIADADVFIRKRSANLRENSLSNRRSSGKSRSPKRNWNPKRNHGWSAPLSKMKSSQHSTPMTQQSNKGVRSTPSVPPSCSLREKLEKLRREDSGEASSGKFTSLSPCCPFHFRVTEKEMYRLIVKKRFQLIGGIILYNRMTVRIIVWLTVKTRKSPSNLSSLRALEM